MWKNLRRPDFRNKGYVSLSIKDEFTLVVKSLLVVGLLDYCFYQSPTAVFPLLLPGACFYQMERKELLHKRKEEARQQFKEMLLLTVTGQRAGYSVENAFLKGYEELAALYGKDSSICRILNGFQAGLSNNQRPADLWKSIGDSCDIEEIKEFAAVFGIAKESSGDIAAIMERTARVITGKAETQKEIETILSARKLEQKIMNIMPFFLMLYINITSPGYFNHFYHNLQGAAIMTACLLVYIFAYFLGIKMTAIEV